jgi:hypothetical protein
MPTYKVKFELYGKKMQTEIEAESIRDAENKIRQKVVIHEVRRIDSDDFMTSFLNMIGK